MKRSKAAPDSEEAQLDGQGSMVRPSRRKKKNDDGFNLAIATVRNTGGQKYLTGRMTVIILVTLLAIVFVANEASVNSGLSSRTTEVLPVRQQQQQHETMSHNISTAVGATTPTPTAGEATDPPSASNPIIPPTHLMLIDAQPMPKTFRFYVYDHFANNELSPQNLSECIKRKHQPKSGNCDWGLHTCVDDGTSDPRYASRRKNSNADVLIADLFLRYPVVEDTAASSTKPTTATPFAIRTLDANQADAFIVPYAHDAHCNCHLLDAFCPRTPEIKEEINAMFASLPYYNSTAQKMRHLFISSKDSPFAHQLMKEVPMRTTLGDLRSQSCVILPSDISSGRDLKDNAFLCPHIVIPYLNTNPSFQPPELLARPDEWWTTRPRKLAVAAVFGRMGPTSFRGYFLEHIDEVIQRHGNANNTIGGLPTQIGDIPGERNLANEQTVFNLYRDSIFCLILPGDGPAQKRFFDVISNGCIPVVFVFHRREEEEANKTTINDKDYPSWWDGVDKSIPKQQSLRSSYPFPKGFFLDQPSLGIDYSSFVVQIHNTPGDGDGNNACDFSCGHQLDVPCQFGCFVPELERIMASGELFRLRRNLQKAAVLFNYGMQENAFQSFDAFAVILTKLGHHLERLPPVR